MLGQLASVGHTLPFLAKLERDELCFLQRLKRPNKYMQFLSMPE